LQTERIFRPSQPVSEHQQSGKVMVKGGRRWQQGAVLECDFEPAIKGIPHGLKITNRVAFWPPLPKLLAER
jgi:hypothetical protein